MVLTATPQSRYDIVGEVYNSFFQSPKRRPHLSLGYEGCLLLWEVLSSNQPTSVLDAGSGLTSVLVRYWAQEWTEHPVHTLTLDRDPAWLMETWQDLMRLKLPPFNLYRLEDFKVENYRDGFDLLILDHSVVSRDLAFLEKILNCLVPSGLILLNEWNLETPVSGVTPFLREKGFAVTVREESRDLRGRFSATVERI